MKNCPYCGTALNALNPFSMCPDCGQPIEDRYSAVDSKNMKAGITRKGNKVRTNYRSFQ